MKITNRRTGTILLDNLKLADTFYKRFIGLMGKKKLSRQTGLKIEPCNSIHCFFMRITIDVIFLSKDDVVLKIIHGMKPWSVSPFVNGARYVIESNANELLGKVEVGDVIEYYE